MSTKAIIFDLDGTAIPNQPDGRPSARLINAVKNAPPSLKLAAATGRPTGNAWPILHELGLTNPCAISGGTQVIDPVTKDTLWEALIPPAAVEAVLQICRPYHHELVIRNELMGEGTPASQRPAIEGHVNVMYLMQVPADDTDAITKALADVPGITCAALLSWAGRNFDIHITPADGTKEHGITEVLRRIGVSKADTTGVGDADNDVHLFHAVGHKIAMGNATPTLKKLADQVIASVSDDGLAKLIEELSRN
jgi:hydroxymethylpyrimidine pyrophosphatase-like HAD family hydrolase